LTDRSVFCYKRPIVINGSLQNHRPRFEVRATASKHAVRLFLAGELDLAAERIFQENLEGIRSNGFSEVVFDLRDLTFIDSTGLRLIIAEWERSRRDGYDFVLVRGSDAVQRVLEATGLEKVLPIVDEAPDPG
jgi:anti-anti-sigma factor